MKVIGAGFGRTGTLSLKRALEDLGFGPTYHMQEIMRRPSHIRAWHRFARTGHAEWDSLFSGFGSGVDYPVCCVWEGLAAQYSQAKVVLTVRDPEKWWESTASTIYGFRTAFAPWTRRLVRPVGQFIEMVDDLVWDGLFDGRFLDKAHAMAVYERHVEDVQAKCSPDRLLVFNAADGWEPLCSFLGAPVPDRPFPRLNDAAVTRRVVRSVRWSTRALPYAAAPAALAVASRQRAPSR